MSEDGQMYSEYNIHVSDVADCEVEIVLCAGGGAGGGSSGYPGPGGGGAGEVKQGTITLQKNSNYTLRVGLGGHNKAFFVYTGKGNNTTLSGPGIDNIGIQAHGGEVMVQLQVIRPGMEVVEAEVVMVVMLVVGLRVFL